MALSPQSGGRDGRAGVRVLVVALVVQLVLAGAIDLLRARGLAAGSAAAATPSRVAGGAAQRRPRRRRRPDALPGRRSPATASRRRAPTASTRPRRSRCCAARSSATARGPRARRRCGAWRATCARGCRAGASSPCPATPGLQQRRRPHPGPAAGDRRRRALRRRGAAEGFVGANDGAAGTAAVVEIARALARRPVPRGAREIRFVLFDGEEEPAGTHGLPARRRCAARSAYVARHGGEVGSMVLLDYIANRGLRLPRESRLRRRPLAPAARGGRARRRRAQLPGRARRAGSSTTTRRSSTPGSRRST